MRDEDEDISRRRMRGGGSVAGKLMGKKWGRAQRQIVHRVCTGNAERAGGGFVGFGSPCGLRFLSDGYNLHAEWKKFLASL